MAVKAKSNRPLVHAEKSLRIKKIDGAEIEVKVIKA
jgi:hypothetical protein